MYLILTVFCCLGLVPMAWTMRASGLTEWAMLAPFVAANGLAAWAGLRGGRAYPGVLTAVGVDLAAGMFGLLAIGISLASTSGLLSFIPFGVAAIGTVMAFAVEHIAGVSSAALPVRGEWGRRLLAGCAALMLQPASPGILLPGYALLAEGASVPSHWIGLWLISALFYLAPVYRRIVSGVPAYVDLSRSHARATTLSEFLAADSVVNPNVSRSFARFVVRWERTIYCRLLETHREPDDAGRRCRGFLRALWFDPKRTTYDDLTVQDLQAQINDPDGPLAPVGCERLLLDLALDSLAFSTRVITTEWIDSGEEYVNLKSAGGMARGLVSRKVHLGIGEALSRIALALPAKHSQGNSKTDGND